MGRYTGPRNKIARRFGVNLGLKTNAVKVARRLGQQPGVHGPKKTGSKKGPSAFGRQLEEKQKAKYIYGLRERQLRGLVDRATAQKGNSETHLLEMLESRLDNTVYRMGYAVTRAQARQMVNHGMFTVNGKKMDIPSYPVKVGDEIGVKANKQKKPLFANLAETLRGRELPSWVTIDPGTMVGKVTSKPQTMDFEKVFDAKFIIEYFSTR